jgi:hypothetical protein
VKEKEGTGAGEMEVVGMGERVGMVGWVGRAGAVGWCLAEVREKVGVRAWGREVVDVEMGGGVKVEACGRWRCITI